MMRKKLFSALLAAAMVFGLLCTPAFAALPSELVLPTEVGIGLGPDGIWIDLMKNEDEKENYPVKVLYYDLKDDGSAVKRTKAENLVIPKISYVPLGTTFTVSPASDMDYVMAYSDPDGDGVYEQRLIRSTLVEDLLYVPEVVELSDQGPFVGSTSVLYGNCLEWGRGKNWLGVNGYMEGYRILTTDLLVELYGANTIIRFCDATGERGTFWYLTGHERGAELGDDKLENYGISATASGHLTSKWAKDVVVEGFLYGLIPLYMEENHNYDLRGSVTRGEFAGVAVQLYEAMSGEEAFYTDKDPFTDVDPDTNMYTFIMAARDLGIVRGNSTTAKTFGPNELVSRQDAALMLSRVYEAVGGKIPAGASTTFDDNGEIGSWAMDAVAFMSSKKIINGMGGNRFDPRGNASVEQALKIAVEMMNNLDA